MCRGSAKARTVAQRDSPSPIVSPCGQSRLTRGIARSCSSSEMRGTSRRDGRSSEARRSGPHVTTGPYGHERPYTSRAAASSTARIDLRQHGNAEHHRHDLASRRGRRRALTASRTPDGTHDAPIPLSRA